MKKYESYKTIGLPWLEKIPEHWKIFRNKNIFEESKETVGENFSQYTLLSLTLNGIIPRDVESGKGKFPQSFDTYKIVNVGDMAFCLFDIDETPRTVGLSTHKGMLTGAYNIFHVKNINSKYINYYYLSLDTVKAMKPLYTGLRKTIGIDTFMGTKIPVPPYEEQNQIVRYLDWQTFQINKLIVSKKKQMEALKEHELYVRNSLLTKGVNSNICFQETGSNWMGKIPAHWKVSRIVKHFTIKKRIAGKEGYDVLSITQQGLKVKDISKNEGQMAANYAGYQFVYPGDFAMNHMDLLTGYIDISKQFGVTSPDYRVFVLDDKENCFPEYYLQLFQMCYKRKIFYGYGRGAANQGRWRMPAVNFRNFEIPFPPYEEQVLISEKIKGISVQTESVCKKLDEEIRVLSELKNRLVSDVVTGQIDVRGIKVPEFELMEELVDDANPTDDITEVE